MAANDRELEQEVKSTLSRRAVRASAVLLVEPDPDLQWRLARMLTVRGHRVVGASSGESASALLAQWAVDIVFIDERLHESCGLEVAERIRKAHPHIPVVLLARSNDAHTRKAAILRGISACIARPFRWEKFRTMLSTLAPALPEPAE